MSVLTRLKEGETAKETKVRAVLVAQIGHRPDLAIPTTHPKISNVEYMRKQVQEGETDYTKILNVAYYSNWPDNDHLVVTDLEQNVLAGFYTKTTDPGEAGNIGYLTSSQCKIFVDAMLAKPKGSEFYLNIYHDAGTGGQMIFAAYGIEEE